MSQLPFIPDQIYQRKLIHDQYGGNRQSGICPSRQVPYIFIFTGSGGHKHGYRDRWENDKVFSYTGEGQDGDMTFTRGNLALRESLNEGKRVFLFAYVRKGWVKFVSEVEYYETDFFETHDSEGNLRTGIKFFFKRSGAILRYQPRQLNLFAAEPPSPTLSLSSYTNGTDTQRLITTRVGQGAYRKSILHRWEYSCAVTKFEDPRILIASHIVPWREGTDNERLDVDNGLLLSPTYDALFDRSLISFDQNGKIELSTAINKDAYEKIGVSGTEVIQGLSDGNKRYLERHRELLIRA